MIYLTYNFIFCCCAAYPLPPPSPLGWLINFFSFIHVLTTVRIGHSKSFSSRSFKSLVVRFSHEYLLYYFFCNTLQRFWRQQLFCENCVQKIDNRPNCIQYKWTFPTCVPWDTRKCEITSQRRHCTVLICKVNF